MIKEVDVKLFIKNTETKLPINEVQHMGCGLINKVCN